MHAVPTRRDDLDGLRGVSIALVVIYHVWFGRVSGGVDVFLVLSGFFFGGRLLRLAGEHPSPPPLAGRSPGWSRSSVAASCSTVRLSFPAHGRWSRSQRRS